ncbi:MAG: hypothetical protein MAG453_00261 [Calditrichaeota bacterium]|nr:hypothetical protein [Calditrichota bacterium]
MNVFDFAMQMEKDGEAFYRDLAMKTRNKGLSTVLTMIADEEVKHYNIFKSMKEGSDAQQSLPPSDLMKNTKNIFKEMSERGEEFPEEAEHRKYYEKAKAIEDEAVAFYTEKAEETDSDYERDMLLAIADEERRHSRLFQEFIDFVARPNQWLEDAEWNHLEDY